ncbi:hypothetical protein COU62_02820 [Candidatus Pacearchaeota archaeon CG10_big_fil_rev_8_21_14_0_10_35_219]|nr:DUF167 domain-containing protein [Candidatus Pacearchaeota archaeon]PIO07684.1 MAG: hypothetical protein COU62_02820 [Candidatus Pacearchaeota archaeon CG10_big_fil_rev_8_21_14_0_10_35_219]PIY81448.1 MAG: hypothetical protein COY79_02620 [Candidatus Pacearchaeota archaeon CG_4_10_14_0_8_um_filter_35_169]PIZ79485.1 MAG: hypothetical protein COY00_03940 [Candidatus Pacearchaeota archaeon CG_4_10_14_0_2_um_filter_35_33]PJA69783.1 MAG: hypothetical protein CO155_03455 [Candidatus Pacearchaeota a
MIIKVKVKPGSLENKLEKISDDEYIISVRARPEKGKANESLLKLLKKKFPGKEIIIKTRKGRRKLVEVR